MARFSEKDMKAIEEKAEKTKPLQIENFGADGKIQVIVRPGIYLLKQWDKKETWNPNPFWLSFRRWTRMDR